MPNYVVHSDAPISVREVEAPVDPGYGRPVRPPHIDNSPPAGPPPMLWPRPPVDVVAPPIHIPPDFCMPPGSVWPPLNPPRPDNTLPGGPPGEPGDPPPRPQPSDKFLVAIVTVNANQGLDIIGWTVVDPSLSVGFPMPGPK